MEKLRIKEAIVVEGRYDKNTLSQVVDAVIIETSGFGIFSNKEKLNLLKAIAVKRGIIVLTDSDGAGFMIRNHIKGAIPKEMVKQAYVPDIQGKERRKRSASKEGKLGVEGMRPEILRQALLNAGATIENEDGVASTRRAGLKKADLYTLGLSGTPGSKERRTMLLKRLQLPEHLSSDGLLDVLNALYSREELEHLLGESVLGTGGSDDAEEENGGRKLEQSLGELAES